MPSRTRRVAIAGAAVAAFLLPVPVAAVAAVPAVDAAAQVVLADGHVDYAARIVGGALQSQVKDGTQGGVVWREPADVVFHVRPEARATLPGDPRLSFLGAPGDPVWLIPQVQRAGILWAGWNTQEIGTGQLSGPVRWRLAAVEGPGAFALYQSNSLGQPEVIFNTRDGLPDTGEVPLGTHAHGNWAFSAEGTYRLTFEMHGTRPSGEAVSDTEILTVAVGNVDPGTVPPPPPADPTPSPTPPPPGQPTSGRLTLTASSPRVDGRTLTLRLRLGTRSRVAVAVRRRARTVARARERAVPAGTRRLRVRLSRRLAPGRYGVRVRARAGGGAVTRTLRVRVRPRRSRATAVAAAQDEVTLGDGHVDYAARLVDGRLESQIKDGTEGADRVVWRDPADVVFEVVPGARSTIPEDDGLRFLGEPGDPVWMIPQVQEAGVLWAGWNTEELEADEIDGALTWRLTAVDGPGDVAVFETGSFGEPRVLFDSADGLPDGFEIPLGTHAHGNWAFRARGTYTLTFEMSATRPSGERVRDSATLTVRVSGGGDDADAGGGSSEGGGSAGGEDSSEGGLSPSDGSTSSAESGGNGGDMPNTGAALVPQAVAGVLLLIAGLILRLTRRCWTKPARTPTVAR